MNRELIASDRVKNVDPIEISLDTLITHIKNVMAMDEAMRKDIEVDAHVKAIAIPRGRASEKFLQSIRFLDADGYVSTPDMSDTFLEALKWWEDNL